MNSKNEDMLLAAICEPDCQSIDKMLLEDDDAQTAQNDDEMLIWKDLKFLPKSIYNLYTIQQLLKWFDLFPRKFRYELVYYFIYLYSDKVKQMYYHLF